MAKNRKTKAQRDRRGVLRSMRRDSSVKEQIIKPAVEARLKRERGELYVTDVNGPPADPNNTVVSSAGVE